MKIRAPRRELADTVAWVAQAISKRPMHAALAGIHLTATDGHLTARAYDYDQSHAAVLDVDVVADGTALVSGVFLSQIVGSIKGETVELVADDDGLTVASGRSSYRARTLRIDDFPALPTQPEQVGVVDVDALVDAVSAARLFVDSAASIPAITGVRLEGDGDDLFAVGLRSAGANVAAAAWECSQAFAATPLPDPLLAALKGMAGDVTIGFSDGVLGLTDGTRAVTLRTIEGDYPNWRSTLRDPADDLHVVGVDRDELADAVKRAGALADDTTPLSLTFGATDIEVAIAAGERGEGADYMPAERADDDVDDVALGFSARYLLASIGAMPPGRLRIGLGHRTKGLRQQVVIRPADQSAGRTALVMPKDLSR